VVFADVDPATGLMTPDTLADAIARAGKRKIAAVLPVHLRGDVVDLAAIRALADTVGAAVIEDAAHAVGSTSDFGTVGDCAFSAMTVFSFHPVKTIATGEGGMVTTNDPALAERLREARSHGMTRPDGADPWIYEMAELGYNYRLPDINCALGLSQLAKLDRFVGRRRQLAARYADLLGPHEDQIGLAASPAWSHPALHLLTVLIDFDSLGIARAEVMAWLKTAGVGAQVHYIPVHTQPYYRALNPGLSLPGAEQWYAQALSLPLFPGMDDKDVDRVVLALVEAVRP
jgi:dTDP-4-amino-4,6-dideoxygalactose transaminase